MIVSKVIEEGFTYRVTTEESGAQLSVLTHPHIVFDRAKFTALVGVPVLVTGQLMDFDGALRDDTTTCFVSIDGDLQNGAEAAIAGGTFGFTFDCDIPGTYTLEVIGGMVARSVVQIVIS